MKKAERPNTQSWYLNLLMVAMLAGPLAVSAFEEADHFYLTFTAARLAGLSDEDAKRVASAAVAVDERGNGSDGNIGSSGSLHSPEISARNEPGLRNERPRHARASRGR